MKIENIFFDDGGVLNDNNLRLLQWQKLVYDFFGSKYGKSKDEWAKANDYAFKRYLDDYYKTIESKVNIDYKELAGVLETNWIKDMFEYLDITEQLPDNPLEVAREAVYWITQRVDSAIPGIIEVVKKLANKGYKLYTASAENSWELKGYLKGMGIDHLFIEFYGLDVVNRAKKDVGFYNRMFEHAGVDSKRSIIIDDRPNKLSYAERTGATVIQSRVLKEYTISTKYYYENTAELIPLIEHVNSQ